MRTIRYALIMLVVIGATRSLVSHLGSLGIPEPLKKVAEGAKLLETGSKPLAMRSFDQAIADSPSNQDVRLAVISLMIEKGMYRESIPYIEQAIALPDRSRFQATDRMFDSELYTHLGDVYWKVGDTAEAEEAYQMAIKLYRDNAAAYNNWGYLLAESNQQLDKALELTRKAVALEPKSGCFLDSLGWAYFQKGDSGAAIGYLRKAAELSPSEAEVRLHYARALEAHGNRESALVEYQKVLELSPHNAAAREQIKTSR